jgi:TRAP-type mannitol/chloroaromatic compound transport system substrate-binding protein
VEEGDQDGRRPEGREDAHRRHGGPHPGEARRRAAAARRARHLSGAREKGTIDAAEWVGPYDDEKLGFNKVAKFYYYPGFWEGGPMLHALVNEKKWNELPKHYQAALETACGEANQWMQAKYDAQNPPALRRLVAAGTQLRPFPRAVLEAAEKASYEVYDEMSGKSAHFKRIYPEWRKFRDEQFLWFRVAEQAYDNYTFNSKVGQPAAAKK